MGKLLDIPAGEEGIFTTSVAQDTLDESMANKPMDSILRNIEDTVKVEKIMRPIYNFKASEHPRVRQEKKGNLNE